MKGRGGLVTSMMIDMVKISGVLQHRSLSMEKCSPHHVNVAQVLLEECSGSASALVNDH